MKKLFIHLGRYILRGVLAVIPLFLCFVAIWFLRKFIDKQIIEHLPKFIDQHQIPGLGILLLLISLYFIGLIFSNVLGRQILKLSIVWQSGSLSLISYTGSANSFLTRSLIPVHKNRLQKSCPG